MLALVIYWALWNWCQWASNCRTWGALESPSRQSEFNPSSLATLFKELVLPSGVPLDLSSWMCITLCSPTPQPWPAKYTQTCIFSSLFFVFCFFFNFLSLHWHLIGFPYKTFWRSSTKTINWYPSVLPLCVRVRVCVCLTFQILFFSFPLFVKCNKLIFQRLF